MVINKSIARVVAGIFLAVALFSCKPQPPTSGGNFPEMIQSATEYYLTSPAQGRPPDGTLSAGTRVRIIEEAGSYVRITSDSGITAFVSTGALKKLNGP